MVYCTFGDRETSTRLIGRLKATPGSQCAYFGFHHLLTINTSRSEHLPIMSKSFLEKKKTIFSALNVSPAEYTDLSPKGSIDEGIRELINVINSVPGLVTTSSCAGRVSVYVEGKKKSSSDPRENETIAGQGGKGGGRWIFVSHDPVSLNTDDWCGSLLAKFGLKFHPGVDISETASLIHLKFEPMVGAWRKKADQRELIH
jgi:tRNA wybutosine-synthesizing protein 3